MFFSFELFPFNSRSWTFVHVISLILESPGAQALKKQNLKKSQAVKKSEIICHHAASAKLEPVNENNGTSQACIKINHIPDQKKFEICLK